MLAVNDNGDAHQAAEYGRGGGHGDIWRQASAAERRKEENWAKSAILRRHGEWRFWLSSIAPLLSQHRASRWHERRLFAKMSRVAGSA